MGELMQVSSFDRYAGWLSILAGVTGVGYALAFVVLKDGTAQRGLPDARAAARGRGPRGGLRAGARRSIPGYATARARRSAPSARSPRRRTARTTSRTSSIRRPASCRACPARSTRAASARSGSPGSPSRSSPGSHAARPRSQLGRSARARARAVPRAHLACPADRARRDEHARPRARPGQRPAQPDLLPRPRRLAPRLAALIGSPLRGHRPRARVPGLPRRSCLSGSMACLSRWHRRGFAPRNLLWQQTEPQWFSAARKKDAGGPRASYRTWLVRIALEGGRRQGRASPDLAEGTALDASPRLPSMSQRMRIALPAVLVVLVIGAGLALSGGFGSGGPPGSSAGAGASGGPVDGPPTVAPTPTPRPEVGGMELYGYLPYWRMNEATAAYVRGVPLSTMALFSVSAKRDGSHQHRPDRLPAHRRSDRAAGHRGGTPAEGPRRARLHELRRTQERGVLRAQAGARRRPAECLARSACGLHGAVPILGRPVRTALGASGRSSSSPSPSISTSTASTSTSSAWTTRIGEAYGEFLARAPEGAARRRSRRHA